jgi:hypothetical protein
MVIILCVAFLAACEDIYHPELEEMEELLVIEARLVSGQYTNVVKIFKTIGFNDPTKTYPPVSGAEVTLVDERGATVKLNETEKGIYQLTQSFRKAGRYKLHVVADKEVYVSAFEEVPEAPAAGNIFMEPGEQLFTGTTDQSASQLRWEKGALLYADVDGQGNSRHFRFSGRKVCQYTFNINAIGIPGLVIPVYAWYSVTPAEPFNIAAPPDYSVSGAIRKHPLVFLESSVNVYISEAPTVFSGWIFICQQYAISEQTYRFYSDLKKQLSASGKIFDPLYTQAKGNITCTTDPEKTVLGNFEIASVREYRVYVEPAGSDNYHFHQIPWFWDIPSAGKVQDLPPAWWEYKGKEYPGGLANMEEGR